MENIYMDIAERTGGDIYIGCVGPVRTGKSTFIKRFMELSVLPNITDNYNHTRAQDELPQSSAGRTIMTTEPKFIPNEAVTVKLSDNSNMNVRMIDCVGYMVNGALGSTEGGLTRMVKTPWYAEEIPFDQAAEIGTQKVIRDHSTIGLVITTDGSITDIGRESYISAEERVIKELLDINKPFIVLLNSLYPESNMCQDLRDELQEKYNVTVLAVDCANMNSNDINNIIEKVLFEFPITEISIDIPSWVSSLEDEHYIKAGLYNKVLENLNSIDSIKMVSNFADSLNDFEYTDKVYIDDMSLGNGNVKMTITTPPKLFYKILSDSTGFEINSEGELMGLMNELSLAKKSYDKLEGALKSVNETGYGIVSPSLDELILEEPEIVKNGGKFGVRLRASAPSIHLLRADIETEVNPIMGSEKQSEELVSYLMSEFEVDPKKIWESNIFGKNLHELVNEGLRNKLQKMPDDARYKLRETLQRIINEGSGGLICIIL